MFLVKLNYQASTSIIDLVYVYPCVRMRLVGADGSLKSEEK